jgi:hypothetical protein
LTLNSWRSKRDNEDWKVSDKVWIQILTSRLEKGLISIEEFDATMDADVMSCAGAPDKVTASPRFYDDVKALSSMFTPEDPPLVGLRSLKPFLRWFMVLAMHQELD